MKHLILACLFTASVCNAQTLVIDATRAETFREAFLEAARYQPKKLADEVFAALTAAPAPAKHTTATVELDTKQRDAVLEIFNDSQAIISAHYDRRMAREQARKAKVEAQKLYAEEVVKPEK